MNSYSYEEFAQAFDEMGVAGTVALGVVAIILMITMVVAFVMYIFESIGIYTIAKRRGIANPWLAWIPVGNSWVLGSISDQYRQVTRGVSANRRTLLLILTGASFLLSGSSSVVSAAVSAAGLDPMAGLNNSYLMLSMVSLGVSLVLMVVQLAQMVFTYMCYYDLFMAAKPQNAVAFLILGILFSVLMPFFVFASRNQDEGMPRKTQPVQPAQLRMQPPVQQPPVQQTTVQQPSASVSQYDGPVADDSDFADE